MLNIYGLGIMTLYSPLNLLIKLTEKEEEYFGEINVLQIAIHYIYPTIIFTTFIYFYFFKREYIKYYFIIATLLIMPITFPFLFFIHLIIKKRMGVNTLDKVLASLFLIANLFYFLLLFNGMIGIPLIIFIGDLSYFSYLTILVILPKLTGLLCLFNATFYYLYLIKDDKLIVHKHH